MGIDWGRALASGVAGGAQAELGVLQKNDDEQRWLEKEKQLQAAEDEQFRNRQLYMRGLEPPKAQTVHKAGDGGKIMDQQQNWVIDPTTNQGAWQDVGDAVPNVNQERLDETSRHNVESEGLRASASAAQAEANAARIDVARERLAAEDARHHGGEVQPKPYTFTVNGKPVIRYGTFDQTGTFVPAKDEHGAAIQGDKFRPSVFQEKRDAEAQGVKGTLSNLANAMGLGAIGDTLAGYGPSSDTETPAPRSAAAAPAVAPSAPSGGSHGRVVKTGTKNGQRVAMYEDGYVGPAP
jgi:hypothetical protein